MRIGITGVPGTGKTTLAKEIAKLHNLNYIDINKLIEEKQLWSYIDPVDNAKIVNLAALKRELQNMPDNSIVESHLVCEMELPLDVVIVLRTPLKMLEYRLSKRKYDSAKIRSNIYSELLDYCTERALRRYKEKETVVYEINTANNIDKNMQEIKQILNNDGDKFRAPWIDISKEF